MSEENRYVEGQHNGRLVKGSLRTTDEALRASEQVREREIETMIEEAQLQAREEEERRIAQMNGISETDRFRVGNLMKDYAEENRYNEYLVHGAILTCSNATTDIFVLPDKKEIALDRSMDETARCRMALNVEGNPASTNELSFATVGDTVINENIFPFNCNCMMTDVSREEAEAIANDPECRRFGVCRHLIRLNEKWDNMPRQTGYMKLERQRPVSTAAGVEEILGESDSKMWVTEEEEGITMTSILFCQRGGLISPITSGQNTVEEATDEEVDVSDPQAVKKYMWRFFRDAGFSEVAVAGILANVSVESKFCTGAGENRNHYGLFQQGGKRKDDLIAAGREWAEQEGLSEEEWDDGWKNLQLQCEYALQEYYYPEGSGWLDRGMDLQIGGTRIKAVGTKENFETAEDPSFAALLWAASFERCSTNTYTENGVIYFTDLQLQQERYDQARIIYEEFCGNDANE